MWISPSAPTIIDGVAPVAPRSSTSEPQLAAFVQLDAQAKYVSAVVSTLDWMRA
jgi:hypothetical protein